MSTSHFLIIDDDQVDRELIKRYVKVSFPEDNIIFTEAQTGDEAIKKIHSQKYDCVFLDYLLPDMDGLSILKKFYDDDLGLTANPVVMLTGQTNMHVMMDALRYGVQDYLLKGNMAYESFLITVTKARETYNLKIAQKKNQERLAQSQKMEALGQLTGGVAHDFNNLLTVVLGNSRLLLRKLKDGEGDLSLHEMAQKIQTIETAAKRGSDLIKKLMMFARQEPFIQKDLNITDYIHDISDILKQTLGERINIVKRLSPDVWNMHLDISQFTSLLVNMAVNSRHAMPDGGIFTIETCNAQIDEFHSLFPLVKSKGKYIVLTISDTGSGISEQIRDKVFDPFFTTKEVGKGTGLGLSMAYGFIQQCGGYIDLYSEENRGTVFNVVLPAGNEGFESDLDFPLAHGEESILFINGSKYSATDCKMIEKLGYNLIEARNPEAARLILAESFGRVDLVIAEASLLDDQSDAAIEIISCDCPKLYFSGFPKLSLPAYQRNFAASVISRPYHISELANAIYQRTKSRLAPRKNVYAAS